MALCSCLPSLWQEAECFDGELRWVPGAKVLPVDQTLIRDGGWWSLPLADLVTCTICSLFKLAVAHTASIVALLLFTLWKLSDNQNRDFTSNSTFCLHLERWGICPHSQTSLCKSICLHQKESHQMICYVCHKPMHFYSNVSPHRS